MALGILLQQLVNVGTMLPLSGAASVVAVGRTEDNEYPLPRSQLWPSMLGCVLIRSLVVNITERSGAQEP